MNTCRAFGHSCWLSIRPQTVQHSAPRCPFEHSIFEHWAFSLMPMLIHTCEFHTCELWQWISHGILSPSCSQSFLFPLDSDRNVQFFCIGVRAQAMKVVETVSKYLVSQSFVEFLFIYLFEISSRHAYDKSLFKKLMHLCSRKRPKRIVSCFSRL